MSKKESKELTIKKPNQTIMISNGKITLTQRKAYNVLLHQALQELRLDNNRVTFLISIKDVKDNAGIKATDNWHLKEDLQRLKKIDIEVVKDNGDWAVFSLLSDIEKKGDLLQFVLSERVRQALIANDYYTTLDLVTIKTFQKKHAVILYELAMRYNKVEIPKLTIDEFRKLTGTESYSDFAQIRHAVLDPAIFEINEKSDIKMGYELFKLGRKVVAIKLLILSRGMDDVLDVTPITEPAINRTEIQLFCESVAGYDISANFATKTIKKHGLPGAIKCRDYAIEQIKSGIVAKPDGYMAQCLRDGIGLKEPVTIQNIEIIKQAVACFKKSHGGSCGAEWKTHKSNPIGPCYNCQKFKKQRETDAL